MTWSFSIGRLFGSDPRVHVTFFLLLAWIGFAAWSAGGWPAAVQNLTFVLALFVCVLAHEFGHALTARRYGIRTPDITLLPIGGLARLERMPEKPGQEITVALAGPAVNVVIWLVLTVVLGAGLPGDSLDDGIDLAGSGFLDQLALVNLFLALFNMIPAFPMDGGRVLRAALALRMDHAEATRRAATVGQCIALGMGLLGIMYNPFLLLIAVFVWFGASMENSAEQVKSLLAHATIRHAMLHEFHSLSPEDTLATAVELTLAGSQKDFPVGYRDRLEKVLHHGDLIRGLQERGEQARIGELPLQPILRAQIDEPLQDLLQRMQGSPAQMICVMDGERVAGLLNLENVLELIRIQEAVARHQGASGR